MGVQLAGYIVDPRGGPLAPVQPSLFQMRLQQEHGCAGVERCALVPTYDLSCAAGPEGGCPFGSVHQPHKVEVGRRVGLQLEKMLLDPPDSRRVVQGPIATKVSARVLQAPATAGAATAFSVTVSFQGGEEFRLGPTRNCTSCCGGAHTVDLDASSDGKAWANATNARLDGLNLVFEVRLAAAPTVVRHTAASVFPQCALYNSAGLPLLPFEMAVSAADGGAGAGAGAGAET